jgi:hypothetical protein
MNKIRLWDRRIAMSNLRNVQIYDRRAGLVSPQSISPDSETKSDPYCIVQECG